MPIDMSIVKEKNQERCFSPTGFNHQMEEWSIAEWTNAISGEVGEAMILLVEMAAHAGLAGNIAKKMIRFRAGVNGNPAGKTKEDFKKELAKELADIILYCDLTATSQGIDLWGYNGAVRAKFNEVSDKIGSDIKL